MSPILEQILKTHKYITIAILLRAGVIIGEVMGGENNVLKIRTPTGIIVNINVNVIIAYI